MRKGFGAIFFIIISFFIAAPVLFFVLKSREGSEIRGTSSSVYQKGFSIVINSSRGSWDLYEYGCSDLLSCQESLTSGKQISLTSGGQNSSYNMPFITAPADSEIKYVKFFIKHGWGSAQRAFSVVPDSRTDLKSVSFEDEDGMTGVLIVPVEVFSAQHFVAGTFSD